MKQESEWTDDKLIAAILGSRMEREAAFIYVYNKETGWLKWVIGHVKANGGGEQDGEDVFQESVVLFDRGIREGRFKGGVRLQTYFFGIAKWVWFNILRKKKRIVSIPEIPELYGMDIEEMILEDERKRVIDMIIEKLGKKCKQAFALYKLGHTMEEIAPALGLKNANQAKKRLQRCRDKFKDLVKQNIWLQKLLNINNPGDEK